MSKAKPVFICQVCGHAAPKWMGKCPACGEWNSLVEEMVSDSGREGRLASASRGPIRFDEIACQDYERWPSGLEEFDRVLGGGIVPGSLVLIGGDPGIGKSTLLLQIAALIQRSRGVVLYVSGEESERQIKMRGDRLGIQCQELYLLAETCLERIFEHIARLTPQAIILDSVQTAYSEKLSSAPGSIGQVRETANQFLALSKTQSIPVFLIGHITKDGTLAGPKALEHVVDAVLYFEGERYQSHRIIRTVKNRFGAANELGVFEMSSEGLVPVENPSQLFLAQRPVGAAGSVVICCVEGSRPILVELQALVSSSNYASARRMAAGVDPNRVSLMLAMLEKRLGMQLVGSDVYVNVAGGLQVDEPATDLGVVTAVVSSYRNRPLDPDTVVLGEVGLAGEVRSIHHASLRLRECAKLGFRKCVMPRSSLPEARDDLDLEVLPVDSVQESFEILFQ
ncbi:MAG: DNA repair protein RadA [Acidobacteriota bacterium]